MKKRKNLYCFLIAIIVVGVFMGISMSTVGATELSDNVNEQLENIDLTELEKFYNENLIGAEGVDFFSVLGKMLNGEFTFTTDSGLNYAFQVFFNQLIEVIPSLLSIVAIAIFCGIINNVKSSTFSESTSSIVNFVAILAVALILSANLFSIFINARNLIQNLTKSTEIMSPIILTMMVASGGNISAGIYKPVVALLSGGIANIFLCVILPLIVISCIFNIISDFSDTARLRKLSEFFTGLIKWIIGLVVVIYSFFITAQGITVANYDGISMKAAKYVISNGVPIIGGFLGGGFDLVVAGSVLIKNSIGMVVVFALFYNLLSPVLFMVAFNLVLKFIAGVTEPVANSKIPEFCVNISKSITHLIVAVLMVGLMFFVTILLMIFSANAFVI